MKSSNASLLKLIESITGNGTFAASGAADFTFPGLVIKEVGEIGFPLPLEQVNPILRAAQLAPFGKGLRTIVDPQVRSAWEIDASELRFENPEWDKFLKNTVEAVKLGLGIEQGKIKASLYKLLVYKTGDFFRMHKDSEKEPGMFGTLVVGLPSKHTGGELAVHFDNREVVVDFSRPEFRYKIPYAAFFADCDHEIKPVTSGYRICLVYNLLQESDGGKSVGPAFGAQVKEMTAWLRAREKSDSGKPIAVLLDHQYTPSNFSLAGLKLHDKPRVEALFAAAEQAGYFAGLGLVTHYLMGELDDEGYDYYSSSFRSSRGRGRYAEPDDEQDDSETMGSVFETSTSVEHWSEDGAPGLGDLDLEDVELIARREIGSDDPIEKLAEGYTGNAGMTIEYWYHYGAVILWPYNLQADYLSDTNIGIRLRWLGYYLAHWNNAAIRPEATVRELIAGMTFEDIDQGRLEKGDLDPLVQVLLKLNDEKFLKKHAIPLLLAGFREIRVQTWMDLLARFKPEIVGTVFEQVAEMAKPSAVDHLLGIIQALTTSQIPALRAFSAVQINRLPVYLKSVSFSDVKDPQYTTEKGKRKERMASVVEKILALSEQPGKDKTWHDQVQALLTQSVPRSYVNDVLAKVLLAGDYAQNSLAQALREVCIREIGWRVAAKPAPPADWRREIPTGESSNLDLLRAFMDSPTEQVFDYVKPEKVRSAMESAIRRVKVDLKVETIKQGSPYTLRITKTQAAYERAMEKWAADVALLKRFG